jgi:two-component system sensor histidine kinase RpfC
MNCGGDASAYLFPLYFWMILGNGLRFGGRFMGAAVVSAAAGFAATVASTPFWSDHMAFSCGLFLALLIIPLYGGLLLRRLAEAHAEAKRANHAKTLLLACVSHELRTPLTAIVGLSALLRETRLDEEQREMVQTLSSAGSLLLRHVEGLLTLSRDEINPDKAAPERVDLLEMLISLRALLAVEAEKKGLALGLCVEADTPRHIVVEPDLLRDVLQNLVGNAVKFTPRGAVAIHAGVIARDAESADLRVEVHDTGIGLEKAAQKRIFESFVQADPDIGRRFGGSGLGLAIARRRLETRGGRIGVESEIGEGACFWFELTVGIDRRAAATEDFDAPRDAPLTPRDAQCTPRDAQCTPRDAQCTPREPFEKLPFDGPQQAEPVCLTATGSFNALALARRFAYVALARDDDSETRARGRALAARMKVLAAGQAGAPAEGERRPDHRREPRKILLAEDNGVNRMVLDKILGRAGHVTTLVDDGEAALEAMLEGDFDLILLDLNMPGINGVEAAGLYRMALPPEARAPILALTADADQVRRAQCEQAGMIGVLTKPVTPDALLNAVAAACRTPTAVPPRPAAREPEGLIPALDPAALAALAALGGDAFLCDVSRQFLRESEQIVERLTRAVESCDFNAFRHEAHALNSSAGNIGAVGLARLCREWRDAGPDRLALHGAEFLDALRCEWSRVWFALHKELGRNAGRRLADKPMPDFAPGRRDNNPAQERVLTA